MIRGTICPNSTESRSTAARRCTRDDVTVHKGLPVTSPARTLVDAAEFSTREELRVIFHRAREIGLLDLEAVRASRSRVEWRPSLGMLDEVIAEFEDDAGGGSAQD